MDLPHWVRAVLEHKDGYAAPQPDVSTGIPASLFTRDTDPFQPARVAKILELVQTGGDLSPEERAKVVELIGSNTDIFALSVGEVWATPLGVHRLDIKPGVKFSTKVQHRRVTPSAQTNLDKTLNNLLATGILKTIPAKDVKCCSPVKMAQKAHSNQGLSVTELQHRVNEQCIRSGMAPHFDIPPRKSPSAPPEAWNNDPKW